MGGYRLASALRFSSRRQGTDWFASFWVYPRGLIERKSAFLSRQVSLWWRRRLAGGFRSGPRDATTPASRRRYEIVREAFVQVI